VIEPPPRDQVRDRPLGDARGAPQVHVERAAEVGVVHRRGVARERLAGVGHHDVDAAERVHAAVDRGGRAVGGRDIGGDRGVSGAGELAEQRIEIGPAARDRGDPGAFSREPMGDRAADAAARAAHQAQLPCELEVHG
jgi:hypothetical protein